MNAIIAYKGNVFIWRSLQEYVIEGLLSWGFRYTKFSVVRSKSKSIYFFCKKKHCRIEIYYNNKTQLGIKGILFNKD